MTYSPHEPLSGVCYAPRTFSARRANFSHLLSASCCSSSRRTSRSRRLALGKLSEPLYVDFASAILSIDREEPAFKYLFVLDINGLWGVRRLQVEPLLQYSPLGSSAVCLWVEWGRGSFYFINFVYLPLCWFLGISSLSVTKIHSFWIIRVHYSQHSSIFISRSSSIWQLRTAQMALSQEDHFLLVFMFQV